MAKLTVDEKEYETDDFNDEQRSVYNELMYISNVLQQQEYVMRVTDSRKKYLVDVLKNSLNAPADDDNKEA